jgi:kynurenine formamidase
MTTPGNSERPPALDSAAFSALYQRLRDATPWGPDDRRGGLNYITPDRVLAAAAEVRLGRTVTLEAPIETHAAPDNPEPAMDEMTGTGDQADPGGLTFARDRLTMNVHGNADSHIDALCHVMYRGRLYNGVPADTVTSAGADELSIEMTSNGIVGRGVLLDIPRLHGVPWLEPGDHVTLDDLTRAEEAQQVRVGEGDLLFVRVGHRERRNALGPWDSAATRAGLHPTAMEFVAERKVAALGSDSNNDTSPSVAEGVDFPVHVLALNAMGLHLLDWLQFDGLAPHCADTGRWSFCCVIAPLRLEHGTGSPVNPIAIL